MFHLLHCYNFEISQSQRLGPKGKVWGSWRTPRNPGATYLSHWKCWAGSSEGSVACGEGCHVAGEQASPAVLAGGMAPGDSHCQSPASPLQWSESRWRVVRVSGEFVECDRDHRSLFHLALHHTAEQTIHLCFQQDEDISQPRSSEHCSS